MLIHSEGSMIGREGREEEIEVRKGRKIRGCEGNKEGTKER